MPEMDGLTAAKEIRQTLKLPNLPIIAMTAHAMEGDIEKSVIAGMNQHLTKPIEPKLLYQTLTQYLGNTSKAIKDNTVNLEQSSEIKQKLAKLSQETDLGVDEAIKKIQGKEALYAELVHDFWLKYQTLSQEMMQYYETTDTELLYRSAHSLKSTAQYIGCLLYTSDAADE